MYCRQFGVLPSSYLKNLRRSATNHVLPRWCDKTWREQIAHETPHRDRNVYCTQLAKDQKIRSQFMQKRDALIAKFKKKGGPKLRAGGHGSVLVLFR